MFEKARIPVRAMLTQGVSPPALRRRRYRNRGYTIGRDVEFAPGAVIEGDQVEIGDGASFGLGVVVRGRRIRIGAGVHVGSFSFFDTHDISIGDDTVIREQVFVGGPEFPDSRIEIGKRVRIFQTCFLNPSKPLVIGDETGVGGRSSIFTHGSWQSVLEGYPVAFAPVTIGRNVWLPWHVFILPGVEIGDGATIGAGSVINRSIPAGSLAVGVPAKVIKEAHEWPRPIAPDEQWSTARSIFAEFVAHLEDNGVAVDRSSSDDRDEAVVRANGTARRVALVRVADAARPDDEILLELEANGATTRPQGAAWFSLLERVRGGPRDDLVTEVEDWLERYGIRFAPLDES